MDLASVAEELYGLPPSGFTAARDSQAAAAKSSGDVELTKAIKQLRRPTTSAWLANLLVRRRAGEVDRLLVLGDDMRRAQSKLEAKEMRALADERRKLVSALAKDAANLARELDKEVNDSSIKELQATLEAAVSDPAASESLRSGNLTKALEYSGFGPVDLTDAVAIPIEDKERPKAKSSRARPPTGKTEQRSTSSATEKREEKRTQAKLALREAQSTQANAERSTQIEKARLDRASGELDRLTEHMQKLEKQLDAMQAKANETREAVEEAKKAVAGAVRSQRAAADRVSRAEAALDRL